MKNFRFIIRLGVGLFLLLTPIFLFAASPWDNPGWISDPEEKVMALRLLVISLLGVGFITFTLCSEISSRRNDF